MAVATINKLSKFRFNNDVFCEKDVELLSIIFIIIISEIFVLCQL